jgi:predicted dehydrogenase
MVGHTFLYNNLVRDVKERIQRGELGELQYAYSRRLNLGRFRRDSDVMWTLAPHDVSILDYWFDSRPSRVSAHGRSHLWRGSGVADVSYCLLEYPDGRSAHLHLSWMDPQKVREMVLVGDRKMLVYDDVDSARHIQLFDKGVEKEFQSTVDSFADFRTRLRSGDLVVPNLRLVEPLAVEIDHFVGCVLDSATPLTDPRHGLEVTAVLAALDQSMKDGGTSIPVEYPDLGGSR